MSEENLTGDALLHAVLRDEEFMQKSAGGFQQINKGHNIVVTLDELREAKKSGERIV